MMHSGGKTISYQCRQTGCLKRHRANNKHYPEEKRLACPSRGTFSASFEYQMILRFSAEIHSLTALLSMPDSPHAGSEMRGERAQAKPAVKGESEQWY